jgi:MFS family permease
MNTQTIVETAADTRWIRAIVPLAMAHLLSYAYRTINVIIFPYLMHDLGLEFSTLGLLTSMYFLTFAAAQLPLGIALDRFGPRKVQTPMLAVAGVGAVLFSYASDLSTVIIARAMIGLGVSGSLMAGIKAGSLWLPSERLPLCTGILLAMGGLGAMFATVPLQFALELTSWRTIFVGLGVVTLLLSLVIFTTIPEKQQETSKGLLEIASALRQIFANLVFWQYASVSLFAHAAYMAILGLWMGPWLRDIGHLDRFGVARTLFVATLAMVAGSLVAGFVTDRAQRVGFRPVFVCGLGILMFILAQVAMMVGGEISPQLVAVGFAFFGAWVTMNYAILSQNMPLALTGRVTTCFNLLVFAAAFGMQWGFGAVISFWQPIAGNSYPISAYRVAIAINLVLQLAGMLVWFSLKPWRRAIAA